MRVVVVLPTYNEVTNVGTVIPALLALDCAPDVLVVDDNSPDGTADRVRELMTTEPRLSLHPRPRKEGLGSAYVAGFTAALSTLRYDVLVQMDADGAHEPNDLPRLVAALDTADLAIGSRYVNGGTVTGWSWSRRVLSRGANDYARLWLRLGVRDLTTGFKAWRAATLANVGLGQVRSTGPSFHVETTARAAALGTRIVEIPISFHDRSSGSSKTDTAIAAEALRAIPSMRRRTRQP